MSTPVLQNTSFQISKEYSFLLQLQNTNIPALDKIYILETLLDKYSKKMKQHITLLEQTIESEEIKDIFTKEEQQKLGEYQIQLEKHWTPDEQTELFKHWASHMSVYIQVEGTLKGVLETQKILVSLIKLDKRIYLSSLAISFWWGPCLEQWMSSRCKAFTKELADYMESLDFKSFVKFDKLQIKYGYGYHCTAFYSFENVKKIQVFWIKYMPFYLEMKFTKNTVDKEELNLMEQLIVNNSKDNDLESVMEAFLKVSTTLKPPKNVMSKFLEFVTKQSISKALRKIAQKNLAVCPKFEGGKAPNKKRGISI